ncbi:MAG TPA: hypothetical protein ENO21_03480 [Firmicutes bacterium]|nr:hypothetical protein [Bacillota bacterium]
MEQHDTGQTAIRPVDAVLLAAGINHVPLYPGYRPDLKAVLEFGGEPSLVHVLRALGAAQLIRDICVVGPPDRLRPMVEQAGLTSGVAFIPGGETLVDSVTRGLEHFSGNDPVLLVTADLPLLSPDAVDEFVARCQARETFYDENIYLSGVDRSSFTGRWRRAPVKFLRFARQAVVHGNLALLSPSLAGHELVRRKLDALYRVRKRPFRSAFVLGLRIALAYVLGAYLMRMVTLRRLAGLIGSSLKLGLVPVKVGHPGIALDVDEPKDYRFVKRLLEQDSAKHQPEGRGTVQV